MTLVVARAVALTVALQAAAAQGDANMDKVQALLARPPVLCGQFDQSKTMVGLRRPVKSAGRFCIVAEKGVLWTTVTPFPSTLRLTRDEIIESQGDKVTKRLSASQEPAVRIINDLLFSVMAGELKRLMSAFAVDATVDGKSWRAKLDPRESGMKTVIAGIELNGGEYVKHITIREASGDRTDITFSGVVTGVQALLPAESQAFEPAKPRATPPGGDAR